MKIYSINSKIYICHANKIYNEYKGIFIDELPDGKIHFDKSGYSGISYSAIDITTKELKKHYLSLKLGWNQSF